MEKYKKIVKQVNRKGEIKADDLTIGPNDGHTRSTERKAEIAALAKLHHGSRSAERLRRNAMLSVQYKMEHYVQDDKITYENIYSLENFVKDYLKVLGINKVKFAGFIEMDGSNLNKYYIGVRRFNTELALKFAYFFHTPPDLWLKVQIKNELLQLQKEKDAEDKYSKYDYEKILQIA